MELNNNNYFSPEAMTEFLSVSQYKDFMKCEAHALAKLRGEAKNEATTALLVGSYVDAYYEGTLDAFKEAHPEIFKRDGSLKADYVKAEEVIERTERDRLFSSYMDGRKQVIFTGELFGYPWKIKVDSFFNDVIVDLKVVKDFNPIYVPGEGRISWVEYWGYDIQGAIYQEIVKQNTGKRLPFVIAGATKEKTVDIGLFEIPQARLDIALKIVENTIDRVVDVKTGLVRPRRCEACDYCKDTKELTEVIPYEEEAEE